jgi:hypothetical protein
MDFRQAAVQHGAVGSIDSMGTLANGGERVKTLDRLLWAQKLGFSDNRERTRMMKWRRSPVSVVMNALRLRRLHLETVRALFAPAR